tara:strand:+ start:158 stop:856 length:699 start_codon:yes stop_codon:yes gene_type:complete
MDLEIKKIIDLHKIDQQIIEIHESKGSLPSIITKQEEKIEYLKTTLKDSKKELKSIVVSIDDYSGQSSDVSAKIKNYNDQVYSVKNNKEYEALLKEIDFLKGESANVDSDLSISKAKKEEIETILTDSKTLLDDLVIKIKLNYKELKDISASTDKEEKQLSKNKEKLLKNIKNQIFVSSYLEGTQSFKLAVLSRDACSSCYSSLPPQFILNVKKGEELYPCPSCGINLYWEE